jgi:hypothetical protein
MANSYEGRVRLGADGTPEPRITIDNIDSPTWHGDLLDLSPAGVLGPVTVVLLDGEHQNKRASAVGAADATAFWFTGRSRFS